MFVSRVGEGGCVGVCGVLDLPSLTAETRVEEWEEPTSPSS